MEGIMVSGGGQVNREEKQIDELGDDGWAGCDEHTGKGAQADSVAEPDWLEPCAF